MAGSFNSMRNSGSSSVGGGRFGNGTRKFGRGNSGVSKQSVNNGVGGVGNGAAGQEKFSGGADRFRAQTPWKSPLVGWGQSFKNAVLGEKKYGQYDIIKEQKEKKKIKKMFKEMSGEVDIRFVKRNKRDKNKKPLIKYNPRITKKRMQIKGIEEVVQAGGDWGKIVRGGKINQKELARAVARQMREESTKQDKRFRRQTGFGIIKGTKVKVLTRDMRRSYGLKKTIEDIEADRLGGSKTKRRTVKMKKWQKK